MVSPLIAFPHWLLLDLIVISLMLPSTISISPSSVPPGTYLPPAANPNHVVLTSPDGMFNLNVEDGDLLFQYDGNQTAWQTHTAGMGVHNLSLQDSGNLVLQSKQGATLWQSFDQSPVLGFYSGMNFTANTTLYSICSSGQQHRLQCSRQLWFAFNGLTFYDKHSTVLGSIAPTIVPPSNSTLRIGLIDPPSGNLLAFYRIEHAWVQFYNSSLSACENPKYCSGNFYVCDMGTGACRCPPGFKQSGLDCEPPKPLPTYASNCSTVVDSSLYSIVSVNVSFQLPQLSALAAQYSAEVCGSLCVKNCSCKAALYDPATSSCSLFSVLQTVPTRGNSSQVMLLKVLSERSSPGWKKVMIGVVCATIVALCLICVIVILVVNKVLDLRLKLKPISIV